MVNPIVNPKPNLGVTVAGILLQNPVMTASGTFNSGREFAHLADLHRLGAVVTKGVSSVPWPGNPPPRIAETHGGMLNAIGLHNPGAAWLIENDLPFLRQYDTKIIVNLCGKTVAEYVRVALDFQDADVDAFELNISCPNVAEGGLAFGTDAKTAARLVAEVKKHVRVPLIVKLSPNVTDIADIAQAVEAAGADAVSLINTLLGMKIDVRSRRPLLANTFGGLSGPAVKPVALRMVYTVAKKVAIPVIGMGGIATADDALEFLLAGATAVAVGTANFANPRATMDLLDGLEQFLSENGIADINELIGAAQLS